ncbi:MAG: hypothetical protein M1457_01710 [bacterium]|nr:hypothetical protein [bacterium]
MKTEMQHPSKIQPDDRTVTPVLTDEADSPPLVLVIVIAIIIDIPYPAFINVTRHRLSARMIRKGPPNRHGQWNAVRAMMGTVAVRPR